MKYSTIIFVELRSMSLQYTYELVEPKMETLLISHEWIVIITIVNCATTVSQDSGFRHKGASDLSELSREFCAPIIEISLWTLRKQLMLYVVPCVIINTASKYISVKQFRSWFRMDISRCVSTARCTLQLINRPRNVHVVKELISIFILPFDLTSLDRWRDLSHPMVRSNIEVTREKRSQFIVQCNLSMPELHIKANLSWIIFHYVIDVYRDSRKTGNL